MVFQPIFQQLTSHKRSDELRSGDIAGQNIGPPHPIHLLRTALSRYSNPFHYIRRQFVNRMPYVVAWVEIQYGSIFPTASNFIRLFSGYFGAILLRKKGFSAGGLLLQNT